MTLISLVSKQIWPQVLAVLHAQPTHLVLVHSDEANESKRPAERLRDFFASASIPNPPTVQLVSVPHDRFQNIVDAFADVAERRNLEESNCRVHLSGGNKLMAMAAAEWCRLAKVPCFYIERNFRIFPFLPQGADLLPQPDFKLDANLAHHIDPLALLKCQLGSAEIVNGGQRLTLRTTGKHLSEAEFQGHLLNRVDFTTFLDISGPATLKTNFGDGLEFATAVALLKLGVPSVQRGIRLRSGLGKSHREEETELDLVFNWAGKLWLVDCKHRQTPKRRLNRLREVLNQQVTLSPEANDLLNQLAEELKEKEMKPLKEDLLAMAEFGGLLGRGIAVRWNPLPVEANEFARSRNLPVVLKDNLMRDLKSILFPDQPASLEQLKQLAAARTRALS